MCECSKSVEGDFQISQAKAGEGGASLEEVCLEIARHPCVEGLERAGGDSEPSSGTAKG